MKINNKHNQQLWNKNCRWTEPFEQIGRTQFMYLVQIKSSVHGVKARFVFTILTCPICQFTVSDSTLMAVTMEMGFK